MSKIYTALGLMSGTSLDGVDAAILRTDGEHIISMGPGLTLSESYRHYIEPAIKEALAWRFRGPAPNAFAHAEEAIHSAHKRTVDAILDAEKLPVRSIDIIGFHGQTIFHLPPSYSEAGKHEKGQTLQLGQGHVFAQAYGVPCAYDFRTADMKAGGQGAPLAPIYHKALVNYSGLSGTTAVLNLGGVGNVTLVMDNLLRASDTGPANGPIDSWLQSFGFESDYGGQISCSGQPDFARIERWLRRDFFKRSVPKSADRYDFDVMDDMASLSLADGAASLCAFSAMAVAQTIKQMMTDIDAHKLERIICCGGGRHNKTLMTMIEIEADCPVYSSEHFGWNSDMIEAQAFAYLAVRTLRGLPISFPDTTGVPTAMTGGKIAFP